ncbi:MAG: DUF177 domain-containing protein [Deltaproteobacteria bacterium]|nr:DUF177 domain-containing protein [Deltaproteobacteria bacterium]
MKINVITIPAEGLSVQFSLAGSLFPDLISEIGQADIALGEVDVTGSIKRYGESLSFLGHIETVLAATCGRCLEEAKLPIQADFSYTLLPATGTGTDEVELQTEDLEIVYYDAEIIDLNPMIAEQIILQIPMKVLCRESCRGLCPQCGTNLNMGGCDCRKDFIDPRWTVLKKFKIS